MEFKNKNNINKVNNNVIKRNPIITIAGHIDHGKTTLLNYLSKKSKVELEFGGITQYIKPYDVCTKYGNMTFLDTPGHFAFNLIRKKSIMFSDILVLIISAEDGVMTQTIETIDIAKNFNIPIVVAINKIDKVDNLEFKIEKIINDLSKYNLIPESRGGDVLMTRISAKTGFGIDELLDFINFQAEILDLKSDISCYANGFILDSRLDLGKGNITTIITLNGFLKKGDIIQIKSKHGKIKSIIDFSNNILNESRLSVPLYITGLPNDIEIGEKFFVVDKPIFIKENLNIKKKIDIKDLMREMLEPEKKKINLIIKADVRGSVNVLKDILNSLSNDKILINIIKLDMGNFNTSDIDLSISTNSMLIGFNVKYDNKIKKILENNCIKIYIFNVIYDLIDHIKWCIENNINDEKEVVLGVINVKKIFKQEDFSVIAGCFVLSGKIKQNSFIKIFRRNILIHKGFVKSIKVFKTDVTEVKAGFECGISIKDYNNIQVNDKIKVYSKNDHA